ncbi:DJ-1/PfpI family protein [Nocardioides rubriscoriae]|uniref:DJ-1/PfpI family protein n=1 Tax=Nocardioides rubriscoriae TaxID=642762 RepID=UPI001FE3B97B|nr:DJ-1/PfpI family protein [Nocardioides rubriscoriae]
MTSPTSIRTMGILAFDDMEVLDYAGPYEVFNVASERWPGPRPQVRSIGTRAGQVVGRGGFAVVPDADLGDDGYPDVLVVPGGAGTRRLLGDREVVDWVRSAAHEAQLVLSVCTGALVLAAAGLLDDRPAATHHGALDELAALSPSVTVVTGRRFVQSSDRVWTSAGVSAGIDLSLHAVDLLAGPDLRDQVVEEMEWGW